MPCSKAKKHGTTPVWVSQANETQYVTKKKGGGEGSQYELEGRAYLVK